jgi:hypothetical protein
MRRPGYNIIKCYGCDMTIEAYGTRKYCKDCRPQYVEYIKRPDERPEWLVTFTRTTYNTAAETVLYTEETKTVKADNPKDAIRLAWGNMRNRKSLVITKITQNV